MPQEYLKNHRWGIFSFGGVYYISGGGCGTGWNLSDHRILDIYRSPCLAWIQFEIAVIEFCNQVLAAFMFIDMLGNLILQGGNGNRRFA
jgi:hypothetical protein